MKKTKNSILLLFSILILRECAPPPIQDKIYEIKVGIPKIISNKANTHLSRKKVSDGQAYLQIQNSTATINYKKDYKTMEHQIILIPQNLAENKCFSSWYFSTSLERRSLDNISTSCKITNKSSKKDCTSSYNTERNIITFSFSGNICEGDILTINYQYKEKKSIPDILYKQETVSIPLIENAIFCNYKFIISNEFIDLGLQNNILTKLSDKTYMYNGQCPKENKIEIIRYSPEKASWNANLEITLEYIYKFTNDVTFTFPRYYIGGKIKNNIYTISSLDNEIYNQQNYIYENINYKIKIPASNKNKVGIKLNTNFTNNLNEEFNVYLPQSFYEIDISSIDQEIIDKANEIIKEESDKPNYYKLGKFVNSYMTYDISYSGRKLSLKEIYERKKGVCEHYTILYNAMLNAIGIKTLYISGWAFEKEQTSGDINTISHAWTAALIDNKWKELDATWGLFEGVPAGHVMKIFNEDIYSYFCSDGNKNQVYFNQNSNIKANFIENTEDKKNEDTTIESTKNNENEGESDDDDDDVQIIVRNYSIFQKPLLFLFILFCFNLFI